MTARRRPERDVGRSWPLLFAMIALVPTAACERCSGATGRAPAPEASPAASSSAQKDPSVEAESERERAPAEEVEVFRVVSQGEGLVLEKGEIRLSIPLGDWGDPDSITLFAFDDEARQLGLCALHASRARLFRLAEDLGTIEEVFSTEDSRARLRLRLRDLDEDGVRELLVYRKTPGRHEIDVYLPGRSSRRAYALREGGFERAPRLERRMPRSPDPEREAIREALEQSVEGTIDIVSRVDLFGVPLYPEGARQGWPERAGVGIGMIGGLGPSDFGVHGRWAVLADRWEGDLPRATILAVVQADDGEIAILERRSLGAAHRAHPERDGCHPFRAAGPSLRARTMGEGLFRLLLTFTLARPRGHLEGGGAIWEGDALTPLGQRIALGRCPAPPERGSGARADAPDASTEPRPPPRGLEVRLIEGDVALESHLLADSTLP